MTEAEWLACHDLTKLLKATRFKPNGRKIRLLICGWCKRRWDVLDSRYQQAIEVGERYADGLAGEDELNLARATASSARKMYGVYFAYARSIQQSDAVGAAGHLAHYPYEPVDSNREKERAAEMSVQLLLVRCVFGNPFQPVAVEPAWLTSSVVALAEGIYADRAFDRMPILADALQDAGCENADVLAHCRSDGPHVRGCWVVDLLLGKE